MWQSVRERWQSFSLEQKLSVWVLGVCGIFAVVLSLYHIQQSVYAPFLVNKQDLIATKQLIGTTPAEDEARQKRTDTDGDGLSDWDEINVFHTNPNLKDSCGDGIPDNVRVVTGKNIACLNGGGNPGGLMDVSAALTSSGTPFALPTIPTPSAPTAPTVPSAADLSGTAAATAGSGSPDLSSIPRDPTVIRQALQGKVDQSILDTATDQQLLDAYDQAMSQYDSQSAGQTSTGGTSASGL